MASGRDLIEHFEIETEVFQDAYVHIFPVESLEGPERAVRTEVWTKRDKIGSGGFGTIWKVQESNSKRIRAVKEVDKQPRGFKIDHYLHELLAMARCSKELSSFVKFEGWFQTTSQVFIAMEYLELGDLESCVKDSVPESEAQSIVAQVTVALQFMHNKKFSHRDINAKNILVKRLGPKWWVKLGDFGIAKRVRGTGATSALKTVFAGVYIAPEQDPSDDEDGFGEDSMEYDCAVDMWSLGHVAHWLLTSSNPFTMSSQRETLCQFKRYRKRKIPFPTGKLGNANSSLDAVSFIEQCMAVSPSQRISANSALQHPWLMEAVKPLASHGALDKDKIFPQNENSNSTLHSGFPVFAGSTRYGFRSLDELLQRNKEMKPHSTDDGKQGPTIRAPLLPLPSHTTHLEDYYLEHYDNALKRMIEVVGQSARKSWSSRGEMKEDAEPPMEKKKKLRSGSD